MRLCCCLLLALSLVGCAKATSNDPLIVPEPEQRGITQPEAQALWDELATAVGSSQWSSRRSQIETATLASFDLQSLMERAWSEDINARVLAANPDVLKNNTGEGQFPGYIEADKAGREQVLAALKDASDADLFADAWTTWNSNEESDAQVRIPSLLWQSFSVLTDAIVRPSSAANRVVTVEGTGTVLVTFKTNMTFSPDASREGDWTNRYIVEKRDGRWVIVAVTNLGDYAVAVVEADLRAERDAAKNAADKLKAKPSDAELAKAFPGKKRLWMGQDKKGRWWVAALLNGYSDLAYRTAPGKWVGVSSAGDSSFWVAGVPPEVVSAMKKAGLPVVE